MPTKQQLYQTWATEFQFPETRREDDPLYRKPQTPPPMSKPLPEEIKTRIGIEAIDTNPDSRKRNSYEIGFCEGYEKGYETGGTAYCTQYLAEKERADRLEATLYQIANGAIPYNYQQALSWIDTARQLANEAINPQTDKT